MNSNSAHRKPETHFDRGTGAAVRAMILAAGRGERMRPLTDRLPKPLLEVGGKALIVWQIERLCAAGITDIVINHSYLGHMIEAALGDGRQFGVDIAYSREAEALDTAGGVGNAMPLLGTAPFALVSGDLYVDFAYARLSAAASAMQINDGLAHLVLIETAAPPPYDFSLENDDAGTMIRSGVPRLTFSGIGVFRPALFAGIARGTKAPLLPLLFDGVAQRRISGELFAGDFANLTTPPELEQLDRRLRGHPSPASGRGSAL
jgi:N-acetyl-alpha-D-muramate 1-phosphate uridylyltransferase